MPGLKKSLHHTGQATRLFVKANGGWEPDSGELIEEANIIYSIAMSCNKEERAKLSSIAIKLKEVAKQKSIYIKQCTGKIEII